MRKLENRQMSFQECQSALSAVRELIEAYGAQTIEQILSELMEQAIGCNNIHDAKRYGTYAIEEFKRFGMLVEEEIDGEVFYSL